MREKLLSLLVEPGTYAALRPENIVREGKEIVSGNLVSEATGKAYPIVRGIPRFVPSKVYADNFGKQWNMFREVQVDSETRAGHSRSRFDDEVGWTADDVKGKWVLDAGCGAGRFAEVAAERGGDFVGLDLSSAVEATKKTLERFPNVDVVQASMLDMPFRPSSFDFAYSIGVLQHTPDPQGACTSVARVTKENGGRFAMTAYARRPWSKLNTKYLIRPFTKRLPDELLLAAIKLAMPVAFPVTDALYRLPVIGQIARFTIPVACYPERTEYTRDQRYAESVLDTFDMLAPTYDSPMTWQEIERALRKAGAREWSFRTKVPINVYGTR